MAKLVTLADIAQKLNVSTVTVSKALSGQTGVSEKLRAEIKRLANELGYLQPSAAKLGKSGECYVGVVISDKYLDKYATFYWQLYHEVAAKALQKDCLTILEILTADAERKCEVPKILKESKVQGIVIIGQLDGNYMQMISTYGRIPIIYLDVTYNHHDCDAVISDNYYGMYSMTNYLIEKGHKSIAFVGTLLSTESINDRYMGYCKALLEHGIQRNPAWVIDDRDKNSGRSDEKGFELKLPDEMPTAFACNCDSTAGNLIKLLESKGYRIPEDISVVGFDNYIYPGLCDVNITTYEVDIKEMARKCINNILHKINGENYKQGINIIEGRIVEKNSVNKVNG